MNKLHENKPLTEVNVKEINIISKFVKNLLKVKTPDEMLETASKAGLKKTLNAFDLIVLGVGAIIGSGIFTVVGIAIAGGEQSLGAGPAIIVSMVLASLACVFSAMCYSEFASMIPVAGSAYLYTYATMGELLAFIIGWVVMLEYLVGYVAVSAAWTGYFMQFLKGFDSILPPFITNPPPQLIGDAPIFQIALGNSEPMNVILNLPGIILAVVICSILIKGIKESTQMAGAMVVVKLSVIALFVISGLFYVKPENWTPFAPNGFEGIFCGAFIIFFAYIGFDAIATAAEETKEPQKNLPIGIIGSLLVCTIVYVVVALVLTGMMPVGMIDLKAPIAHAMHFVGQNWIAGLISIGALAGLTSVLLVLMLAPSRILYAMSRDNFLPKSLQKVHKKFQTPYVITLLVAMIVICGSFFLDIGVAAELCIYGTFTSFIIVCVAVLILRKTDPNRERPFKVPFSPWFPLIGITCCTGLMLYFTHQSLSKLHTLDEILSSSPVLFVYWVIIGVAIYFAYSYAQKRKVESEENDKSERV